MNHLTTQELEAIRKRAEQATEGPWQVGKQSPNGANNVGTIYGLMTAQTTNDENADFIAAARTDIPKLLAEVDRYKDVERKLRLITDKAYETSDPQLFTILHEIKDALYGGD